ncbi:MAG: viral A-type inclusion protein [Chitinophagaceae bacterium]
MKTRFSLLAALILLVLVACNNDKKEDPGDHSGHEPKSQADSLMADVMDGHDAGMAKYGKLKAMEQKIKASIDSIAGLPAKTRDALAPYRAKLDSAAADLRSAINAMDKWMEEFDMDSAANDLEKRIRYLMDEKMKVGQIKESILNSLSKADSLLKSSL